MLKKNTKPFIYLVILVIPFLIVFFRPAFSKPVKTSLTSVFSGPLAFLSSPINEIKRIFSYRQTYEDYLKIKREYETLKGRLIGLQDTVEENARYKRLLDFKGSLVYSSVAARVIGRDPTNWNASVLINKGKVQGVKLGMPVVTPLGVVGRIAELGSNTSKVILVSDPNFSVAAVIQNSRESGLLTGTLQGICRLRHVPSEAQVRKGDRVVTSKLSSAFPEGLLIGEVTAVEVASDSSALECLVRPAVRLSQIEEVLVIKSE